MVLVMCDTVPDNTTKRTASSEVLSSKLTCVVRVCVCDDSNRVVLSVRLTAREPRTASIAAVYSSGDDHLQQTVFFY